MRIGGRISVAFACAALFACSNGYPGEDLSGVKEEVRQLRMELDSFKKQIKIDGDSVDLWIAAAHEWILWVNDNLAPLCQGCEPPDLPPNPPPDGEWE